MQVMHVIARRDHRLEHANGSFAPIRDIVYRPYGASAAEAGHQAWARDSVDSSQPQRARSRDKRQFGSSMRSLVRNFPLLERGIACSRENGWPARTTGSKAPSRIAGGHVARVCGYQGSTEATLQQSKTPHSACPSHGIPPQVPIGVRPVDGAAR